MACHIWPSCVLIYVAHGWTTSAKPHVDHQKAISLCGTWTIFSVLNAGLCGSELGQTNLALLDCCSLG